MSLLFDDPLLINHVERLLKSYLFWTGRDLIPRGPQECCRALFFHPSVVLSHGIQNDPLLNYGNQAALDLWEMTWEEFTNTPSHLTAEPLNRVDRERLLEQVRLNGYIDTYRGVRISRGGRRFMIEKGTVWNIVDENNEYAGQAATFSRWTYL
jgi:hypothetical protein